MKYFKIKILAVSFVSILLSSCLKERQANIDTGNGNTLNVVEFLNTGDNNAQQTSKYPQFYSDLGSLGLNQTKTININVSYSGVNTAPADMTVNLAVDAASLTLYNSQNGSTYEVPPADVMSFPSSLVIKKGTRTVQALLTIKVTASFDFSKAYAVPLKITSTSPAAIISGNFGVAVYAFGVRNPWDGKYSYKGYSLRAGDGALTGNFTGKTINLVTTGATSLQFGSLALWGDGASGIGIGNPSLAINTTGGGSTYPVTISSSGGAYNAPGYNSRYEVATKTFYISFAWGAGPAARLSTDTLTYIGIR